MSAEVAGDRLDKALAVLGEMSRAEARRLVESGDVTVDGVARPPRWRVTEGEEIVFPPPAAEPELVAREMELVVRYEDDDVVVVDKPPDVVVHPGAGTDEQPTLAAGLLWRYPQIEGVGQRDRWGLVHRLDRDTSGLLAVALTAPAYEALAGQIETRQVERRYDTLVDGPFDVATGTVDAPIGRDPSRPTRRKVMAGGRPARTHYAVVEGYESAGVTRLAVTLETGRTHQIRVHMAAIDHPVVGDRVYRPGPDRVETPRMFLHATRLTFTHPVRGETIDVSSPLPPDLAAVLETVAG